MKEYVVVILLDESEIENKLNEMFIKGYELNTLETEYTKFILVFRKIFGHEEN